MDYQVKLEAYEGPLELLLKLIQKQEVDIATISVSQVIDQFFDYISKMNFAALEEGSQFLVLAATLLVIKAQLILPKPDDDTCLEDLSLGEEGQASYEPDLLDYLQFKEAAAALEKQFQSWRLSYKRSPHFLVRKVVRRAGKEDIAKLVNAFKEVIENKSLSTGQLEINTSQVNIKEIINKILNKLNEKREGINFKEILELEGSAGRDRIIAAFLAVLELVYMGRVRIRQGKCAGEILIATAALEDSSEVF